MSVCNNGLRVSVVEHKMIWPTTMEQVITDFVIVLDVDSVTVKRHESVSPLGDKVRGFAMLSLAVVSLPFSGSCWLVK